MKTASAFVVMAAVALARPALALVLCPDPATGEYGPEHCDLIAPFEHQQESIECELFDLLAAEQAAPACLDYWAREEPTMVLQFLYEQRQRKSAEN
jgi:hypothetical protein